MKKISILFALLLSIGIQAQKAISLEEAIDIALKSNFDILVARNDADISRINNTRGNAGMLPTVNVNGSGNYAFNHVLQKLSSGTTNKYPSQSVTTLEANTQLSWTLYDGGKMFVTKKKLEEMQSLGELQFNSKVLEVTYNVVSAYYDIIRQNQQLKSMNEVINYNKQRVVIAQTGFNAGLLDKTELLQAKIDLNVSTENAINQKYAISQAQKTLNGILGKDASTVYEVGDSIPFSALPDKNELLLKLASSNASILALKKQIDVANLAVKETQKGYSPTFSLQGGYYLSQTNNSEGSTLKSHSIGPQIGGTLSIPLYNGGETKRKIAAAKIELLSAQYSLENTQLQLTIELENAYTDFENQQQLLQIEKENNLLAKENMEISLQRLKLGQATTLEVHLAQENYVQSCTRLLNFEYNLKMGETKLRQLVSSL
ncbi:MAG: outer rane efflux protein [Bacteroidetes bacterium]|nr:outer rane efflux protein [Bacteroidota bacterium]